MEKEGEVGACFRRVAYVSNCSSTHAEGFGLVLLQRQPPKTSENRTAPIVFDLCFIIIYKQSVGCCCCDWEYTGCLPARVLCVLCHLGMYLGCRRMVQSRRASSRIAKVKKASQTGRLRETQRTTQQRVKNDFDYCSMRRTTTI